MCGVIMQSDGSPGARADACRIVATATRVLSAEDAGGVLRDFLWCIAQGWYGPNVDSVDERYMVVLRQAVVRQLAVPCALMDLMARTTLAVEENVARDGIRVLHAWGMWAPLFDVVKDAFGARELLKLDMESLSYAKEAVIKLWAQSVLEPVTSEAAVSCLAAAGPCALTRDVSGSWKLVARSSLLDPIKSSSHLEHSGLLVYHALRGFDDVREGLKCITEALPDESVQHALAWAMTAERAADIVALPRFPSAMEPIEPIVSILLWRRGLRAAWFEAVYRAIAFRNLKK